MIIQKIGTHQTWAAFSCIEWYPMHDWQGHPYLGKVMQTVLHRSRDHRRTQIQITCTRRDLFLALRSSAHAADNHMYTQVSPTITCTRK